MDNAEEPDITIVGGGIVGLATAWEIAKAAETRFPAGLKIVLLEKESALAEHQTGRNSGVLHSGIYYQPGSLKALNCRAGKLALEQFCAEQGLPFELCGKVIVATSDNELPGLHKILERGKANGVQCQMIDRDRLRELEPHAAGIQAIHVPETGIIDYRRVCERLGQLLRERGHKVLTEAHVLSTRRSGHGRTVVQSKAGDFNSRLVINCAGLQSDRVSKMAGEKPAARIVPFRGEYYELKPSAAHLCRNLIYPVPDPRFPFLGVHFTRMIQGGVECGPNAVLAFAREGYSLWKINPRDLLGTLAYPGFLRMAAKHWRQGMGEMWRSCSKAAFVRALQKLMPEIRSEHLTPAPAGVRAQAVRRDGLLVDDFLIMESEGFIHVLNAPSPAATAALNIGRLIAEKAIPRLEG